MITEEDINMALDPGYRLSQYSPLCRWGRGVKVAGLAEAKSLSISQHPQVHPERRNDM